MAEVIRCQGCEEGKQVICDWAFALRARFIAREMIMQELGSTQTKLKPKDHFEANLEAIDCQLSNGQVQDRLAREIRDKTWRFPHTPFS